MIEERRQDIGEHLEDSDDEDAHDHPLRDLLCQRRLHDLPEEKTERGDDGGDDDRRPDGEAFAEYPFIHISGRLTYLWDIRPPTTSSYTHSYPAARSQVPGRARWPPYEWGSR